MSIDTAISVLSAFGAITSAIFSRFQLMENKRSRRIEATLELFRDPGSNQCASWLLDIINCHPSNVISAQSEIQLKLSQMDVETFRNLNMVYNLLLMHSQFYCGEIVEQTILMQRIHIYLLVAVAIFRDNLRRTLGLISAPDRACVIKIHNDAIEYVKKNYQAFETVYGPNLLESLS
jgi:hypothetical protein